MATSRDVHCDQGLSDGDLLDYLDSLSATTDFTGKVILRRSTTGRGWRLHETDVGGHSTVRDAIKAFALAEAIKA